MPDQEAALKKAMELVNPNGKILFFMTLYYKRIRFLEIFKPILKFLTSMDFGEVIYYHDFFKMLHDSEEIQVEKTLKVRNAFNIAFLWSGVYVVQCKHTHANKETSPIKLEI